MITEPISVEFATVVERDEFLNAFFPTRTLCEGPGVYHTSEGPVTDFSVHGTTVMLYPKPEPMFEECEVCGFKNKVAS